jgi:hypothetical protein
MIPSGHRAVHRRRHERRQFGYFCAVTLRRLAGALIVAAYLPACAPLLPSGRPASSSLRIEDLQVRPARTTSGCPVTISFKADQAIGRIARVWVVPRVWRSSMAPDQGPNVVTREGSELQETHDGSITAVLSLRRYGTNWVHVQVEDQGGNYSNVLNTPVLVQAPIPWREIACRS